MCLGIFCAIKAGPNSRTETAAATYHHAKVGHDDSVTILLGHIIAAKTASMTATDTSMAVPHDWASQDHIPSSLGHNDKGRTLILHSVAVQPGFQGRGLGGALMSAFLRQIEGVNVARLALIAHDVRLIVFRLCFHRIMLMRPAA